MTGHGESQQWFWSPAGRDPDCCWLSLAPYTQARLSATGTVPTALCGGV
jgi:hypothetical protein